MLLHLKKIKEDKYDCIPVYDWLNILIINVVYINILPPT